MSKSLLGTIFVGVVLYNSVRYFIYGPEDEVEVIRINEEGS